MCGAARTAEGKACPGHPGSRSAGVLLEERAWERANETGCRTNPQISQGPEIQTRALSEGEVGAGRHFEKLWL